MKSRLIGTVIATAAVTTCLALGSVQLLGTSTASAAAPVASQVPTDSQLLQQIADNTAATNKSLANINNNLQALLRAENKVSVNTDNTALRLKIVNTNLIALHSQFKATFAYRGPRTSYTYNALSDLMAGLCAIEADVSPTGGPRVSLPPCGGK